MHFIQKPIHSMDGAYSGSYLLYQDVVFSKAAQARR